MRCLQGVQLETVDSTPRDGQAPSQEECAAEPSFQGAVPSPSPSPREKCIKKPACGSPLRRECDLPTIPSPYIVRIGQFDNASYPLHIVREDTLRMYVA